MTFMEKFLLYVGVYTAAFAGGITPANRASLLLQAQSVVVQDESVKADEAALEFVLWWAGLGLRPSFLPPQT